VRALKGALSLGIEEVEAHYACYAPGVDYARHVDRFRDDDARVISLVLYPDRALYAPRHRERWQGPGRRSIVG
jgi:SM-20-related protein